MYTPISSFSTYVVTWTRFASLHVRQIGGHLPTVLVPAGGRERLRHPITKQYVVSFFLKLF